MWARGAQAGDSHERPSNDALSALRQYANAADMNIFGAPPRAEARGNRQAAGRAHLYPIEGRASIVNQISCCTFAISMGADANEIKQRQNRRAGSSRFGRGQKDRLIDSADREAVEFRRQETPDTLKLIPVGKRPLLRL